LSTFLAFLGSSKCVVAQWIPALEQALLGAGDRDRTGIFSLEGLKPGYPRVPNSGSELRLCNVILTVTTHGCPYASVATDTLGTRENVSMGPTGVIDAEPARPDLRRRDLSVDADGCSFASFQVTAGGAR